MLWNASALKGYKIVAADGRLGEVRDFLFKDTSWMVRWLVVETGDWLTDRQVLLPPLSLGRPDPALREFPVDLTVDRVKNSPAVGLDEPVSRQMEAEIATHFGWEPYWLAGTGEPMAPPFPAPLYVAGSRPPDSVAAEGTAVKGDPHLRSAHELVGYRVHATDGEIGVVGDFLIDDADWGISYLKANTGSWWSPHEVLLTPRSVKSIDWDSQQMELGVTRRQVRESPLYNSATTVDRAYETALHAHYGYGEPGTVWR